ncbi:MAG: hypothetical protein ABGW87_04680 [Sphingomonadaceae bacterium]
MSEETGTKIITDEERREALRQKIAASEERNAQRTFADQAKDVADSALDYVRENPLKSVAAVTLGALVIGAMTRRGRKAATKAGKRTSKFAALASDAAIAYAMSLIDAAGDAAETGQRKLSEFGDTVEDRARKLRRSASEETREISGQVQKMARKTGRSTRKRIKDLRSRLTH